MASKRKSEQLTKFHGTAGVSSSIGLPLLLTDLTTHTGRLVLGVGELAGNSLWE
jgi:hypothetical protein